MQDDLNELAGQIEQLRSLLETLEANEIEDAKRWLRAAIANLTRQYSKQKRPMGNNLTLT